MSLFQLIGLGLTVISILGMVGTGVYKLKQWGANEVRAEWAEEKTTQREEEIQRSMKAIAELNDWRKKQRTIIQERTVYVDRNIEKLVESSTCFKPVGVSCINGAVGGKGGKECADGGVPVAPAPIGRIGCDHSTLGPCRGGSVQ